jgi:hypothetical protein
VTPPARERSTVEPEPPPGSGLTAFLWTLAVLLGLLDLIWWWSDRIFTP